MAGKKKMKIEDLNIKKNSALLIVDMQNDFLPGGSLAVPEGDQIITGINQLAQKFYQQQHPVVFSQDWHPKHHLSFASAHPNKNPGDPIEEVGLGPILWPDHCVQNTKGAEISDAIEKKYATTIIRKGYHPDIDSYSTFYDNDHKTKTGLAGLLKDLSIEALYIVGLALDYCCYYSALDAKNEGFKVEFLTDLMRGIDNPKGRINEVLEELKNKGIHVIQ